MGPFNRPLFLFYAIANFTYIPSIILDSLLGVLCLNHYLDLLGQKIETCYHSEFKIKINYAIQSTTWTKFIKPKLNWQNRAKCGLKTKMTL